MATNCKFKWENGNVEIMNSVREVVASIEVASMRLSTRPHHALLQETIAAAFAFAEAGPPAPSEITIGELTWEFRNDEDHVQIRVRGSCDDWDFAHPVYKTEHWRENASLPQAVYLAARAFMGWDVAKKAGFDPNDKPTSVEDLKTRLERREYADLLIRYIGVSATIESQKGRIEQLERELAEERARHGSK